VKNCKNLTYKRNSRRKKQGLRSPVISSTLEGGLSGTDERRKDVQTTTRGKKEDEISEGQANCNSLTVRRVKTKEKEWQIT